MHLEEDHALHKVCVRRTLNAYLAATRHLRKKHKSTQLFLSYGGRDKGKPVSKKQISQWLKMVVQECYARKGLGPPLGVQGHQVQKQATSWADMAGVDPQRICDAAMWKSQSVFAKHYQLDLIHGARREFGKRVLQLAASSSAEASLRRHLGITKPASNCNLLNSYKIPNLPRAKEPRK